MKANGGVLCFAMYYGNSTVNAATVSWGREDGYGGEGEMSKEKFKKSYSKLELYFPCPRHS